MKYPKAKQSCVKIRLKCTKSQIDVVSYIGLQTGSNSTEICKTVFYIFPFSTLYITYSKVKAENLDTKHFFLHILPEFKTLRVECWNLTLYFVCHNVEIKLIHSLEVSYRTRNHRVRSSSTVFDAHNATKAYF